MPAEGDIGQQAVQYERRDPVHGEQHHQQEEQHPTVSTIKKLCDGLDITLGEFFSTPEFDRLEQEVR